MINILFQNIFQVLYDHSNNPIFMGSYEDLSGNLNDFDIYIQSENIKKASLVLEEYLRKNGFKCAIRRKKNVHCFIVEKEINSGKYIQVDIFNRIRWKTIDIYPRVFFKDEKRNISFDPVTKNIVLQFLHGDKTKYHINLDKYIREYGREVILREVNNVFTNLNYQNFKLNIDKADFKHVPRKILLYNLIRKPVRSFLNFLSGVINFISNNVAKRTMPVCVIGLNGKKYNDLKMLEMQSVIKSEFPFYRKNTFFPIENIRILDLWKIHYDSLNWVSVSITHDLNTPLTLYNKIMLHLVNPNLTYNIIDSFSYNDLSTIMMKHIRAILKLPDNDSST